MDAKNYCLACSGETEKNTDLCGRYGCDPKKQKCIFKDCQEERVRERHGIFIYCKIHYFLYEPFEGRLTFRQWANQLGHTV